MMQKLLLAVIALGLWADAAAHLIQPALAQHLTPSNLESSVDGIARDLHALVAGTSGCTNKKICD